MVHCCCESCNSALLDYDPVQIMLEIACFFFIFELLLMLQILENNSQAGVSIHLDQQKVLAYLQGKYAFHFKITPNEVFLSLR